MMCMNKICATKNATYQTFVRIMSFLKKTSPLSGVPDQVSCCSRIRRAAAACGTCTSMRTGFEPHGLAVNRLWMNCLIYFGIHYMFCAHFVISFLSFSLNRVLIAFFVFAEISRLRQQWKGCYRYALCKSLASGEVSHDSNSPIILQ